MGSYTHTWLMNKCFFIFLFFFLVQNKVPDFHLLKQTDRAELSFHWVDDLHNLGFSFSCRSRLSYEHFSAFLSNVKELNAHKQTREVYLFANYLLLPCSVVTNLYFVGFQETLRKAEEIFGPDNKDLYTIFEGLITRNLHWSRRWSTVNFLPDETAR